MTSRKFDIEKIAELALLRLSPEEKVRFESQFEEILTYMETLNEIDTDNVEPMRHVRDISTPFRKDLVKPSLGRTHALMNATAQEDGYFKTKKVMD